MSSKAQRSTELTRGGYRSGQRPRTAGATRTATGQVRVTTSAEIAAKKAYQQARTNPNKWGTMAATGYRPGSASSSRGGFSSHQQAIVPRSRQKRGASAVHAREQRNRAMRMELQRLQNARKLKNTARPGSAGATRPGSASGSRNTHSIGSYSGSGSKKQSYNGKLRPDSAGAMAVRRPGSASATRRPDSATTTSRRDYTSFQTAMQIKRQQAPSQATTRIKKEEAQPSPTLSESSDEHTRTSASAARQKQNQVRIPGGRTIERAEFIAKQSREAHKSEHANQIVLQQSSSSSSKPAIQPTTDSSRGSGSHGHSDEESELRRLKSLMLSGNLPRGKSTADFYHFGKVIGVGSFGKVRLAWHKLTGMRVAIKTYEKQKTKDPSQWKRVQQEVRLMERLNHQHCIRLFEAIETPKRVHIVMDCCSGGSLCSYVKMRKRLHEDEARHFFSQVCGAVDYMHSLNIIHRDIKLENILLDSNRNVKMVDFGFSVFVRDKKLKIFCGTPSYMAPEIVQRREYAGKPVDIWSLGVLLYACLCGCFPFTARSYPELYQRIIRGQYRLPDFLSHSAKDVIRSLLVVDPCRRATLPQVRSIAWVRQKGAFTPRYPPHSAHLISNDPADDLDESVLEQMEEFGMMKETIIQEVLNKRHTSCSTCYYLLLSKKARLRERDERKGNSSSSHSHSHSHSSSSHSSSRGNPQSGPASIKTSSHGGGSSSSSKNTGSSSSTSGSSSRGGSSGIGSTPAPTQGWVSPQRMAATTHNHGPTSGNGYRAATHGPTMPRGTSGAGSEQGGSGGAGGKAVISTTRIGISDLAKQGKGAEGPRSKLLHEIRADMNLRIHDM